MKNLFAWISDVHISIKNLDVSIQVLKEALELARSRKVPLLISGDLNDTKAVMRSEWVTALIDLFQEYSDVEVYALTGNHDMDNKNASTHSLQFLDLIDNVTVIDRYSIHDFDEVRFAIIPYQPTKEDFIFRLNQARAVGIKNIIAHQGILGAFMGDYIVDETSVSPDELSDFDIVLLGHYHKHQTLGSKNHIIYCGSPFTVNFGEADQIKFIHMVQNEGTLFQLERIETQARRHVKFVIESDEDVSKIESKPGSLAQVVIKGPKEFVKKHNDVDKLKKIIGAQSVSIVPEITRQSEHRISAEILHSPLKVIDTYLESADTILDKNKLKEYLFNAAQDLLTSFSSNSSKSFNITRATAKNFLSFKDLDFTYSAMGLTLVEGFDEDKGINTGAGKSSFFDVVVYGLFGQTSKDIKADEVINRIYKKDCEINIYLDSTDGQYQIKRYRKHSKFENDLVLLTPSGKELRGKDNRETQKLIEQELGCSFDLFLKSSYFTQFGAIDRFLSASDTEKKKLISEITDLSIYDNILAKVKDALKVNLEILATRERTLLQTQTAYDTTSKYVENQKITVDQWESNQKISIQNTESLLKDWDLKKQFNLDRLNQSRAEFESQRENRLMECETKHNNFEVNKQSRIALLDKEAKDFEHEKKLKSEELKAKTVSLINKQAGIIASIKEMEEKLKSGVSLREEYNKIKEKLKLLTDLGIRSLDNNLKIGSFNREIESIEKKIETETRKISTGDKGTCNHCYQLISPDLIEGVVKQYKMEIEALEYKRASFVSDENKIQGLLEKRPGIEQSEKEVLAKLDELTRVDYQIDMAKKDLSNIDFELKTLNDKLENLDLSKSDAHYKIDLVKSEVNPFSKEKESIIAEVNPVDSQINRERDSINPYIAALESKKLERNPHIEGLKQKEDDLENMWIQMKQAENLVNEIKLEIALGEWWKQALHVYIKSYLMDSCLDQINLHTNEYLQTLFDGILQFNISATTEAGKDTKEKIDISIINNGDECSYQSLSGGERCRICLAVNLALSNIIAKTNGKNFGMIFLDEILNGLDETGKTQSMKLLKELEFQYPSVFIIDHAEGFKSLFTNSIMIKKKDKISYIV